jgi:hypothetical protein
MPPGLFGRRCAVSALKGKRKTRISYKLASNHSSPAVSGPERLGCLYYTGSERALPEHPVEPRLISVLLLDVPGDQLDVWRSAVATERPGIGFELVTHVYSILASSGSLRIRFKGVKRILTMYLYGLSPLSLPPYDPLCFLPCLTALYSSSESSTFEPCRRSRLRLLSLTIFWATWF